MRAAMTAFARTLFVSAGWLAAVSCAGPAETDVLGPLAAEPVTTPASEDPSEPVTTPATTDGAAAPRKGKNDRKKPDRASTAPSCPPEKEDNNSEAKANALESCVRGTLSGSNDKDFFRFAVAHDGRLLIAHNETNGRVQYKVTEEHGQPVTGLSETFTDRAPDIIVEANKAYFFQLSFPDLSGGGGPRNYEFTVTLR